MFVILWGFQSLTVFEIMLALVCVVEAVPNNEKNKGNSGNNNGRNNSHKKYYSSFQSYINKLSPWSKFTRNMCPVPYIRNWRAQSKNNPLIFRPFLKVSTCQNSATSEHFQKWPKNQGIVLHLSLSINLICFFFYVYFALAFLYKMYKSAEQEVEETDKRDNLPKLDSVLKILMGKVCQKCNVPRVIVNSRLVQEFKI